MNHTLKIRGQLIFFMAWLAAILTLMSCSYQNTCSNSCTKTRNKALSDTILKIVSDYPGEIGVAVIIDNIDTITVNNQCIYPLMSVYKLHQALALCNDFDNNGKSLDSLIVIPRKDLDRATWSTMMKDHPQPVISLTIKELLHYSLSLSDNNASNFLFKKFTDIAETDSFISTLIPRSSFHIAYTEEDMKADPDKSYVNRTSPLGAAILMNRLFTDSLISKGKQQFIIRTLQSCMTGNDRIAAPLLKKKGVTIAHKTGSGYTKANGILIAHNDVAYVQLPNNVCYTLAVFVKDFNGTEKEAAAAISHISAAIYTLLSQQ